MLMNVKMQTIVGILTIYHDKFYFQLSWAWKKFYNPGFWVKTLRIGYQQMAKQEVSKKYYRANQKWQECIFLQLLSKTLTWTLHLS